MIKIGMGKSDLVIMYHGGWDQLIDAFTTWMQAGGCTPQTIRLRRHYLQRLAGVVECPLEVGADELAAFIANPAWAPETRRSARATVSAFYRWMHRTGRISSDPTLDLPRLAAPPGVPRPAPEAVLASALDRADQQGRLMLLLAAYAGLRRGEIATLHSSSVVDDALYVVGKGGRTRRVPLHPRIVAELPHREGYLFPGQIDGHLSAHWVGVRIARLLGGDWTAHTLRHRFATRAYAGERDLLAVQELLGHSKPETTRRYTQIPPDALIRAVMAA